MIKILVLEPPYISNVAYWRLFRPLKIMAQLNPGVFSFEWKRKDLTFADAWNADVVIMARPGTGRHADYQTAIEFIQKAKRWGAKFIVDLDDDLLGIPDDHELYSEYNKPDRRKAIVETLKMADAFWVSTSAFLTTYSPQAEVIPNAVLPTDLPEEPAPDRGLWAWRGRSVQIHDLVGMGADWYEQIKDIPKQWVFLGYRPPLRHSKNQEVVPYLDDPELYMQALKASQFNGIWKPMQDVRFNDHKSNIAWIEATMSGGVCLTNYAGKSGWELSVSEIPEYPDACKIWERSKAEIIEKYNLVNTAQMRAQSIFRLCSYMLNTSPATANT